MGQKYRFVGTDTTIGDRRLLKFGEEITLTPEQRAAAGPRAPLVHDTLFSGVGFTEQELSLYTYPAGRVSILDAGLQKIKAAWALIGQEPGASPTLAQVEAKLTPPDRAVVDAAVAGVKQ